MPRFVLALIILTMMLVIVIKKTWFKEQLQKLLGWVSSNPIAGPFSIFSITLVIVVILIPYTILAVSTGYALSHTYDNKAVVMSVGTACVFFGAWSGAIIAFLLGRYIFRS